MGRQESKCECWVKIVLHGCILPALLGNLAMAKSAYVLKNVGFYPGRISVYDIQGDGRVLLQDQHVIEQFGGGAVGIALDSEAEVLFLTYEDTSRVGLVNARTLENMGAITLPGIGNLAGIVYDQGKGLLYCTPRRGSSVYVFVWTPATVQLEQAEGSPFELAGASAFGIALDEIHGLLYVADAASRRVVAYRTSDWSMVDAIGISLPVISVAIDSRNQLLYTGAGYIGDRHLVQYDLTTGTETSVEVDQIDGVMGLAVDGETGLLYVTTGLDNLTSRDLVMVYSPSLKLIQDVPAGLNPGGLVLSARSRTFSPLNLSKRIVEGVEEVGGISYASPGDLVTYEVAFDNRSNALPVSDVAMVDMLPAELDFVRVEGGADANRVYDPANRSFSYYRNSLDPNQAVQLRLVTQVRQDVAVGTTVNNIATVESHEAGQAAAAAAITVRYNPLHLTKRVLPDPNHVTAQDQIYVQAGATLTYEISVGNPDNPHPVTGVEVVDILPGDVDFVSVLTEEGTGGYNPDTRAYTWRLSSLDPAASGRMLLTVKVRENVPAGTRISNRVVLSSNETPDGMASVDILTITICRPPSLTKTVVSDANQVVLQGLVYVSPGQLLTYQISVGNPDNPFTITGVEVVDNLPAGVDFVRAVSTDGTGRYNPDDNTYTWALSSVDPRVTSVLQLTVKIKDSILPGTLLTNTVAANSVEAPPVVAEAVVGINYRPIAVRKGLISGQAASCVSSGEILTYQVCVDNKDNVNAVRDVTIVDLLAEELEYVSSDVNGVYDAQTHSYAWFYPLLEPEIERCAQLRFRVRPTAVADMLITNEVYVDSNGMTPSSQASSSVLVCERVVKAASVTLVRSQPLCGNCSDSLQALVVLPPEINIHDVNINVPMKLNPGGADPVAAPQVYGIDGMVKIRLFYDLGKLLESVFGPASGAVSPQRVTVAIEGKLLSGQKFLAEGSFLVTRDMKR